LLAAAAAVVVVQLMPQVVVEVRVDIDHRRLERSEEHTSELQSPLN
jgi:hypothetical protein